MEEKRWVDFRAVKAAVTLRMILEHYRATNWKPEKGDELRGPCPLPDCDGKRSFSWNPTKNAFQCFACKARGNVLDFVAKREGCTVKDAAAKLAEWFKVGESEQAAADHSENAVRPPWPALLSAETYLRLQQLTAELNAHAVEVSRHAALVEQKSTAINRIVAEVLKGE